MILKSNMSRDVLLVSAKPLSAQLPSQLVLVQSFTGSVAQQLKTSNVYWKVVRT